MLFTTLLIVECNSRPRESFFPFANGKSIHFSLMGPGLNSLIGSPRKCVVRTSRIVETLRLERDCVCVRFKAEKPTSQQAESHTIMRTTRTRIKRSGNPVICSSKCTKNGSTSAPRSHFSITLARLKGTRRLSHPFCNFFVSCGRWWWRKGLLPTLVLRGHR